MARKPEAKPIFTLVHDFKDSLDAMLQEAVNLMQSVDQALDLDLVKEPMKAKLRERLDAFKKRLMED